jgi:hypothetical protein
VARRPKPTEMRAQFLTARAPGATLKQAAAAAGVSRTTGHYWLAQSGGVRPRRAKPQPAPQLSLEEREVISRGLAQHRTMTAIAASWAGRCPYLEQSPATAGSTATALCGPIGLRSRAPAVHVPASSRRIRCCVVAWRTGSRSAGRRSRSVASCAWTFLTTWGCGCRTRRSTRRCSCRPKGFCAPS